MTGWGKMGDDLPISEVLQKVNYFLYSQRDCARIFLDNDGSNYTSLRIRPENICE